MKKAFPIILVVAGLAVIVPTFFMSSEPEKLQLPDALQGVFIDSPPMPIPEFTLTNHNNQPFTKNNFRGKWSLVFFGFTNCPDVCPTSMSVLNKVSKLQGVPEDTQYVFVSVDGKRDTPEKLKEFVSFFNDKFIGAAGTDAELEKFEEPLGVIYDFEGDTSTDDYNVTHFAAIYIMDPSGNQRAYILPPHSVAQVGEAYKLIYQHYK